LDNWLRGEGGLRELAGRRCADGSSIIGGWGRKRVDRGKRVTVISRIVVSFKIKVGKFGLR
jgi:hypothetical protein